MAVYLILLDLSQHQPDSVALPSYSLFKGAVVPELRGRKHTVTSGPLRSSRAEEPEIVRTK
jgi:hypothetical protein